MKTFTITFTGQDEIAPATCKVVSREHGQPDQLCGHVTSLSLHADLDGIGGVIRVAEDTPWLAEFLAAFPDITPVVGHPMLGIPQEMAALVNSLKPTGYSALMVTQAFYEKIQSLTTSDFDREASPRLLTLGVLGYFRGAPVIKNLAVPPDPGYVLI